MKPVLAADMIDATRPILRDRAPDSRPTIHTREQKRPRTRRWRMALIAATVAAVAGGAYLVWSQFFSTPAPTMMTAAVARGDVEVTVLTSGTLKPVKLVAVGAQASGRITSLPVSLGQVIRKGDLIAEIDSVTQENALRTAKASLANMRAQRTEKAATLKKAELTLTRQKRLVTRNAVSQADLETAEADVATTRAQIDALDAQIIEAEVAVETAAANLGYTRITAPMDGTVLAIVNQEGRTVNASQSAPTIVILGQLDTMTIRAEISEADIVKVKEGQPVYFTIMGDPERRYDATLESIEPAPESITSDSSVTTSTSSSSSSASTTSSSSAIYYMGVFNVPNPEGRLRTYMTAEVHIVLGEAKDVLTVPSAALGRVAADGSATVQVFGPDGKISRREVQVGMNNKISAEIRSGLEQGERVVTGRQVAAAADKTTSSRRMRPPMGL